MNDFVVAAKTTVVVMKTSVEKKESIGNLHFIEVSCFFKEFLPLDTSSMSLSIFRCRFKLLHRKKCFIFNKSVRIPWQGGTLLLGKA